jgi:hypothetical protein
MDTNAVFIAWGKPSRIITDMSSTGVTATWVYDATSVEQVPYWGFTYNRDGYGTYDYRVAHHTRRYIQADVVFQNDRVARWSVSPKPRGWR